MSFVQSRARQNILLISVHVKNGLESARKMTNFTQHY